MLRALALLVPILCLASAPAMGAAVSFTGQIDTRLGAGVGALDPIPPARDVIVLLNFADGLVSVPVTGNVQIAGIGVFTVRPDLGAAATHAGGNFAFVLPLGNSQEVVINYPGVPGTAIDSPTFDLINGTSAQLTFTDNGSGVGYIGTVTAAPEPSTMFALLGMVGAVGGYRRFKSRRQSADQVQ